MVVPQAKYGAIIGYGTSQRMLKKASLVIDSPCCQSKWDGLGKSYETDRILVAESFLVSSLNDSFIYFALLNTVSTVEMLK